MTALIFHYKAKFNFLKSKYFYCPFFYVCYLFYINHFIILYKSTYLQCVVADMLRELSQPDLI